MAAFNGLHPVAREGMNPGRAGRPYVDDLFVKFGHCRRPDNCFAPNQGLGVSC